jgi:PDZ domain
MQPQQSRRLSKQAHRTAPDRQTIDVSPLAESHLPFLPPDGATKLPFRFASITEIVVDASFDGIAGEFQLDTGQGNSLIINRPFAEQNGLLTKYGSGHKASVSGVGGKSAMVAFKPSQFAIGPLTPPITDDAAIMLSKTGSGAEEYIAGTIGNQILRQYKVSLDYGHGAIYLEPDPAYRDNRDWTYTRKNGTSGILGFTKLARRSAGPVEILGIATNGTASRAGLKKGDSILAIDGAPVADLPMEKLFARLLAPPGTAVRLTVRHNGITREVTLVT